MSGKRLTTKTFIEKAKQVHGDKYDYSLVDYTGTENKVKIICSKHGEFEQTPHKHLQKSGCQICGGNKKYITKTFIEKSKEIHGDKYEYSLVEYKNISTKIKVICRKHGIFNQLPYNHIHRKSGCRICTNTEKYTTKTFIERSKQVHGDRYDYSLVEYKNNRTKVKIGCKIHGVFEQEPKSHIKGQNCLKCSHLDSFLTIGDFIEKSNKIHNYLYLYNKVKFNNTKSKIIITCKIHGDYIQIVNDHLNGHGCPICNNSKGEQKIMNFLKNKSISFINEKIFENCKNIKKLKFDFYLPEYNICIEYDGKQHFEPIEYFGGEKTYKYMKINDNTKNDYCKNNNIKLLRIKHTEYNKIGNILINFLEL